MAILFSLILVAPDAMRQRGRAQYSSDGEKPDSRPPLHAFVGRGLIVEDYFLSIYLNETECLKSFCYLFNIR
jgi:hypothetical protein